MIIITMIIIITAIMIVIIIIMITIMIVMIIIITTTIMIVMIIIMIINIDTRSSTYALRASLGTTDASGESLHLKRSTNP